MQVKTEQRRTVPIKPPAHFIRDPFSYPTSLLFRREVAEIFDEQRKVSCFVNKLQGFAEAGESERGAQHLVTVRHLVKRGLQLLDIEWEAQVKTADVDKVVGTIFAMKDHAGL